MSARGPRRLSAGGQIDRRRAVEFRFDGRRLRGYQGDTVASALLANGVHCVSRSFKYRRPRGIFTAGIEEPNALHLLHAGARTIPSARATVTPLTEGLEVRSGTGWPNASFDLLRFFDWLSPLFAAGFYHKTFTWPAWSAYEPVIRRLAGRAVAPEGRDPARYEMRNWHCEVLIIGAGVAGLECAIDAAESGARVLLVEQDPLPGGHKRWDGSTIGGMPSEHWIEAATQRLQKFPDVRVLTRTTAVSCHEHNVVTLLEVVDDPGASSDSRPRERYWIVRAKQIVLATGAIEQPLVFCNNDRPGIMLASAAHKYLQCHAIAPGQRVVIATNNDSAYAVARALRQAQVTVAALLDSRAEVPQRLIEETRALQIPLQAGSLPIDTRGSGAVRDVTIGRLSADGRNVLERRRIQADALLVSGGWNPTLQLFAQAGGKLVFDTSTGALKPAAPLPSIRIVGSAALPHEIAGGAIGPRVSPVGSTARQWVDLRHDVTVADLELAVRENYTAMEHVKRYTTVGMAADQGKTSAVLALQIVGSLRGVEPSQLGPTTLRPPFTPVSLGAIAAGDIGSHFAALRHSPLHTWHERHGALLEDYGEWQRPAAYPRAGETRQEAIRREARVVRTAGGIFDASTLGKIEVHGPDAREFLDRFYINDLATLKPCRARYGLMLREAGTIFDDGTVVALTPEHFLITTTSANAGRVGAWLEEWHQCEWPTLRVSITPVTDQWATIALSGASARSVLESLRPGVDLSSEAMPHLAVREGRLLGGLARIYRVSFSGELTYEISVPADKGPALWNALLERGEARGIAPYGVEALMSLRLEKGFLHLGTDTDGTTVPDDVGWGAIAARKRADYIGKRSLGLPENRRPDRLQLVGLTCGRTAQMLVGSHLRLDGSNEVTDGWITSSGRTALSDEPIALAMLRGGRGRMREEVDVHVDGRVVMQATVVEPPFFDRQGERMNA